MTTRSTIRRRGLLALSVACALGLPLAASAQDSAREQQLEQRVAQLERQLAELKGMIQAQKAEIAQTRTPPTSPATQPPQQVADSSKAKPVFASGPGVSVALHGFINATAFTQSKNFSFGNGQNAEFPVPGAKGSLSGGDVRNTRFWLDFAGPKFNENWNGGGRIEMDFFGGFNGTGPYSREQAALRMRQAYITLNNPDTGSQVQIGQQWEFMFPLDMVPNSLAHIAFPLGFGAGVIGWRYPGLVWMQDLNHGSTGPKWRLDLGVFEGSWSGPGNNTNYLTAGNAGFRPQVEARLHVQDKNWLAFAVAHYSKVDLRGVGGTTPTPIKSDIKSVAYEVGAAWKPGPWVFRGLLYTGKALGELFGSMAQFGDIKETGGFAQVGYSFTPHWSANVFYAEGKPDEGDVIRWLNNGSTGLLRNRQAAVNVQYTSGPYEFGVEYLYDKLDSTTNGTNRQTTNGSQFSLSGLYRF
ncbi:carbohydrate porin [Frateuria defendens]|uniref:carbohydrate porin n=1 Tax=Frateuria defendens TaxID=2219559 RepID=UPI00066FBDB2|nr:carbohydrate porin [Frateuria defendens]